MALTEAVGVVEGVIGAVFEAVGVQVPVAVAEGVREDVPLPLPDAVGVGVGEIVPEAEGGEGDPEGVGEPEAAGL